MRNQACTPTAGNKFGLSITTLGGSACAGRLARIRFVVDDGLRARLERGAGPRSWLALAVPGCVDAVIDR